MTHADDKGGPLRLRGHHLLCLRTYDGSGFTPGYAEAVRAVRARLVSASVTVADGPDDVCAACPDLSGETCVHAAGSDEDIRALDALALRLLRISPGDTIDAADLTDRCGRIADTWAAEACADCEWAAVCQTERA